MSASPVSLFDIGDPRTRDGERRDPARRRISGVDWSDPKAVEGLCQSLSARSDYKRAVEDEAILNTVFATGQQWRKFDRDLRRMVKDPDLEAWDAKITYNIIYPAIESRLARLMRVQGGWGGMPETSDEEDNQVGRVIRQVLRHYWGPQGLNMEEKMVRAWSLAMTNKVAFLHVFWDPNKGEAIQVTPQDFMGPAAFDEPEMAQQAALSALQQFTEAFGPEAAAKGTATMHTGDVEVEVVPLFEILVWPFDIAHWDQGVIWKRRRRRLISEVMLRYPNLDWERISPGGGSKGSADLENYQQRLARSWNMRDTGGLEATEGASQADFVWVDELYHKAGADEQLPEGAQAIVVAGQAVEESLGPLDNPSRVIPFFPIMEKPLEGNLYGTSTVDQMRSGQRDINLAASQQANYRNRSVAPTLMIPSGSVVGGRFTNKPGAMVKINSDQSGGPYFLTRPEMPGDASRTMEWANRYLHDMSGVSAVDLGRTTEANVKSGVAIRSLKEQNDQRLIGIGKSTDRAVEGCGTIILELLQERAVDERLVPLIGENNRQEMVAFNRYSLRPQGYNAPGHRTALVRVASFATIPDTPAEFLGSIQGLLEMQVLDPLKDRELILKGAGLSETQTFWDKGRMDENSELAVIDLWRQGQSAMGFSPPRETDDHEVRLRVLSKWSKSDEYMEIIRTYPHLQLEIAERLQAHKQGVFDTLEETRQLAQTAAIRMWEKYRGRFLEEKLRAGVDQASALAQADLFYPPPISPQTAALIGGGEGGPPSNDSQPGGGGGGAGRAGQAPSRQGPQRPPSRGSGRENRIENRGGG